MYVNPTVTSTKHGHRYENFVSFFPPKALLIRLLFLSTKRIEIDNR